MNELIIRNIRCFVAPPNAVIKPLTFIVGDNSAGKSTLLACIRLAWDAAYGLQQLDFNEDPFRFGAFDQIAHMYGGKKGRARTITIGSQEIIRIPEHSTNNSDTYSVYRELELARKGAAPILVSSKFIVENQFSLELQKVASTNRWVVFYKSSTTDFVKDIPDQYQPFIGSERDYFTWDILFFLAGLNPHMSTSEPAEKDNARIPVSEFTLINRILGLRHQMGARRPFAIAPIRTRPERTYNPAKDTRASEGGHIPMVLAKTFFQDKVSWTALKESLEIFGKEGGLFDYIDVKALGKSESDPFQIRVKLRGPKINYVDVGYGISQVLPILVDALLSDTSATLLLQQPEVHLHPRGQAALGTFLGNLSSTGRRFIVETHSDYLLNRVRSEIVQKKIDAENVSVIFLERKRNQVAIHNMSIDVNGNLKGAPKSYRKFFFDEDRRFLNI